MRKYLWLSRRLAATAILFIAFGNAEARILNVPEDFQTIQAGIDSSQDGDTVLVGPGRYFRINFDGHLITVGSLFLTTGDERYIDSTIIDAEGHPVSVVRFNSREDSTARLTGFVLTGGTGSLDVQQDTCGGGIHCLNASPTLDNLKIIENIADYGGGIFLQNSSPNIENILIEGNIARVLGGGIYCSRESSPVISHTVFDGNRSMQGSALSLFYRCSPIIRNSTFMNNTSINNGGGSVVRIFWGDRTLRFIDCIISGNEPDSIYLTGDPIGYDTLEIGYSLLRGGQSMISLLDSSIQTVNWRDGNIDRDPLFLDPDNGDYSLTADSPCIDAGDPDSPLDPDGTRADMGAFYFHQRDIEVEHLRVSFETSDPWEVDSAEVVISNNGGTPLHIDQIRQPEIGSAYWSIPGNLFDPPIEILPDSSLSVWFFYRQGESDEERAFFSLFSDDPDESDITIEAVGEVLAVPSGIQHSSFFTLHSAFPNPFNSTTTIRFSRGSQAAPTRLAVYDTQGRMVADLWTGQCASVNPPRQGASVNPPRLTERTNTADHRGSAEERVVVWDAANFPAGIYLLRLESADRVVTRKLVLVR